MYKSFEFHTAIVISLSFTGLHSPVHVHEILYAEVQGDDLELSFLARPPKGDSSLVTIHGRVDNGANATAQQWCDAVMAAAYKGEVS